MRHLLILAPAVATQSGCVETKSMETAFLAPTTADRATPAYQACVSAIAGQTGNRTGDVAVFNYLFSQAATQVAEVMFTGSEGAL